MHNKTMFYNISTIFKTEKLKLADVDTYFFFSLSNIRSTNILTQNFEQMPHETNFLIKNITPAKINKLHAQSKRNITYLL